MEPQKVEHLDEICWFLPELKVVMRRGGEPWTDLAWCLLKYPNLYYMTSAFAPRHYPKPIIDATTRGADKIMYAGYFPMGLSSIVFLRSYRMCPKMRCGQSSFGKMRCVAGSDAGAGLRDKRD